MPQKLPIAPAKVKPDTNTQSFKNKIIQIVYSLYQSKEITRKVCNNLIK